MIWKEVLLFLITLTHILFVLFVVVTPFTNSNYFLLLHVIIVPFIIFHWVINNNTCCLTLMEKTLRKEIYGTPGDCLTCRLIEPVYDFKKNNAEFTTIIYAITIILVLISAGKLWYKYRSGEITSLIDLVRL